MTQRPWILVTALLAIAWGTAAAMIADNSSGANSTRRGSAAEIVLGDARKLIARHFFTKADVYLHRGYYPSFIDVSLKQSDDPAVKAALAAGERCGTEFMGEPRDWVERMGRHFSASEHVHLGDGAGGDGIEREILPWIALSMKMEPDSVQTYVTAAYWLNMRLHKPDEAEATLRTGLGRIPGNPELLLELGRIQYARPGHIDQARTIWESAWARWKPLPEEAGKGEFSDNAFIAQRLLASLAELEEKQGNVEKTIHWLTLLKPFSPQPDLIQTHIDQQRAKLSPAR